MNRALWWKAWRELRTASLACLAWMLLCAAYVLFYEWQHPLRTPVSGLFTCALLFQWFAGTCLAILVSQRERWENSLRFTRALPVALTRTSVARVGVAAAALVVPTLIAATVVAIPLACGWMEQAGERAIYHDHPQFSGGWGLVGRPSMSITEAMGFLARMTGISIASGIQFLLVLSIVGNYVRSEKTVGFLGVVLSMVVLISGGEAREADIQSIWLGGLMPSAMVIAYGYGLEEGSYSDLDVMRRVWPALALNLVVVGGLFWLFLKTYGRRDATQTTKRRWRLALPTRWLRSLIPQFHSPLGSLVWLTLRQSVPLVVSGLMVAILMAAIEALKFPSMALQESRTMHLARDLGGTTWFIGIGWSVMVAAGVFGGELQPKLARFWSSRPISPAQWLLVKYLTGLAAVLLVIDGSAIVSGFYAIQFGPSVQFPTHQNMSWAYVAIIPLHHALVYSLAVAMVIATRSGVFGAGLALGVFTILQTIVEFVPQWFYRDAVEVHNDLRSAEIKGSFDLWQHGYPGMVVWSVVLIGVFYIVARRRLQRQLREG